MTGHEGNSSFCFPRISMLRFEGNKINCFPRDQSLSDLLYLPTQKIEQIIKMSTNLPRFQGADHVRVESSSCCFPRELVSFVRPRELMSFDPWNVTRSPPIGKRILSWEV